MFVNMASFREFPVKPLPTYLLMDLRRRGIRVPPEVQMRIMFYSEIAETRRKMKGVAIELNFLSTCRRFGWTRKPSLTKRWRQVVLKSRPYKSANTPCHHCKRHFEHALSVDMMAEVSRPNPNLDRVFNACMAFSMNVYHSRTNVVNFGERVAQTRRRPAHMDTVDKIWDALDTSMQAVAIILRLEQAQEDQAIELIVNLKKIKHSSV